MTTENTTTITTATNLRDGFALEEMQSVAGRASALVETRRNKNGKAMGTRLHFGATPETSALLCDLKTKLATATKTSRTEAGRKLAEFMRNAGSLANLQARIALECDFAQGKIAERRDGSANGDTATYRLVTPKGAKNKAKERPAPTLDEQLDALSDEEFQQLVAGRAARIV